MIGALEYIRFYQFLSKCASRATSGPLKKQATELHPPLPRGFGILASGKRSKRSRALIGYAAASRQERGQQHVGALAQRPRFQVDDTAQVVAAEVRPMTAPAQGRACARGSAARHTSTRQPLNARLAGRASLGGAGGGGPNQGGLSPPPGWPAAGAQRFRRRGNIQTAGGL